MRSKLNLPLFFLVTRGILLIALPLEGLRGYGDFIHFYRLAGLGRPFLDYWTEFPPLFPFLSGLLHQLAGGQEHIYDYLLAILLSIAQMGNLALFQRLAGRFYAEDEAHTRGWIYFALLSATAYGWWYFDPLANFTILLALVWICEGRFGRAGCTVALGTLIKWFPLLILPGLWRYRTVKQARRVTLIAIGGAILVWGSLYVRSPDLTWASLNSQLKKGSWETVWALLDGNLTTGNFGPILERYDPSKGHLARGNTPRVPPLLVLGPFAVLGYMIFRHARFPGEIRFVTFSGLTLSMFFLWSPGWSPQWVLYLLPFILLTFPRREGSLMAFTLILTNLLEWPVLLSRGIYWGLWVTVPLRTFLLVFLSAIWTLTLLQPEMNLSGESLADDAVGRNIQVT